MAETKDSKSVAKKPGRPKKNPPVIDTPVNEENTERLLMEDKAGVEQLLQSWRNVYNGLDSLYKGSSRGQTASEVVTVMNKWNELNPFLQNQRIKNLYTQAKKYGKADIASFLENPGNNEVQLRSLAWANSSSQQIFYNVLRRASDVPLYNYYVIPDLLDSETDYSDQNFKNEDKFINEWLEVFNVKNTFKTIALEVKREGKSSYLLRNKDSGSGKNRKPEFCTLQKMPTDWIKITGKGLLGYTISFDMMYFLNMGNSPKFFGEFIEAAWADMINNGIVSKNEAGTEYVFYEDKAVNYQFAYGTEKYKTTIESTVYGNGRGRNRRYMFWLQMPFDICYTFGSDNSHPWMAPDTMGLMLKMQELTDYCQLAGLIASTPLTAVLTGEIEPIPNPRAGKSESIYAPEIIQGMQDKFNAITSTNVEAFFFPAKNIKLQQLSADVNSSEIISTATSNFIESAGEGGLTITTDKPNVAQINVAKQLAASQQNYITLQFENAMNFIIQHKLNLKHRWKIRIWGDIFNNENDKKFLKEIVANGNIALLPKLMSAEGLSLRDTKAITEYIEELGFYKKFMTYTQLKSAELKEQATENSEDDETEEDGSEKSGPGRPKIAEGDLDNDNTAEGVAKGTNTSDGREQS